MSHSIDKSTGTDSMAYRGKTPWHKLGVKIGDGTTATQALTIAHLDWQVETVPNLYSVPKTMVGPNGQAYEDYDTMTGEGFQVVRQDTHQTLANVGSEYTPIQNRLWAETADSVMPTGFDIETAFALDGGRKVGFLFRQNEKLQLAGEDHEQYFLWINDHTGGSTAQVLSTFVRVVCANTLALALGSLRNNDSRGIRFRHSTNVVIKLKDKARVTEMLADEYQIFNSAFERMRDRKVTGRETVDYFKKVLGIKRPGHTKEDFKKWPNATRKRLLELGGYYTNDPTQQGIIGTAYGLMNAVTGMHENKNYGRSGGKNSRNLNANELKAMSYIDRTVANRNKKAVDLALDLVEQRPTLVGV